MIWHFSIFNMWISNTWQRRGKEDQIVDCFSDMTELKSQFYHQYSAKDEKISRLLLVNIKEGIVLENAATSKHAECEQV